MRKKAQAEVGMSLDPSPLEAVFEERRFAVEMTAARQKRRTSRTSVSIEFAGANRILALIKWKRRW